MCLFYRTVDIPAVGKDPFKQFFGYSVEIFVFRFLIVDEDRQVQIILQKILLEPSVLSNKEFDAIAQLTDRFKIIVRFLRI